MNQQKDTKRTVSRFLDATLPLLDEKQQSFKTDYYDVPEFWTRRTVLPPDGLKLNDPVSGICFMNDVAGAGGDALKASPTLSVCYRSKTEDSWKRLVELEPISEDVRNFILLAARRFLQQNSRKRNWQLQGAKASKRTIDIVLGSVVLPVWGLLHGSNGRFEANLRKISEVMKALRAEMDENNPSVLEAKRDRLDREIDDLVFGLYGMGPEERALVVESTRG